MNNNPLINFITVGQTLAAKLVPSSLNPIDVLQINSHSMEFFHIEEREVVTVIKTIGIGTGRAGGANPSPPISKVEGIKCVSVPNIWIIVQHRHSPRCNVPIQNLSPTIIGYKQYNFIFITTSEYICREHQIYDVLPY